MDSKMKELEERLGYMAPVVIASALVAKKLHKGQKDKGGNDYFESHLLVVGSQGSDWKEQAVGFLHDAAEDTPYSEDEVVEAVRRQMGASSDNKFAPSDEEWNEVKTALHVLNHHHADNRIDYIQRIKQHKLALRVKLNDLRNNMDISRIPHPSEKDYHRLERYKSEYADLTACLNEMMKK